MISNFNEKIYLRSPVFMQNILVSIYGFVEHLRRYRGDYKRMIMSIRQNEFKSKKEIDILQKRLLQRTLWNAVENVPYYRSLKINKVQLESFPVLAREDVFDIEKSFISDRYKKKKLLKLYTGGSSGTPLTVYVSKSVRQKTYAFWNVFYQRIGFAIGDKKASFIGRKLQEPDNHRPPFWRLNLYDQQLLFSSYHLSRKNLPMYVERLNRFRPVLIEGYPQSIMQVANHILEQGIRLEFKPKGISTSSENFTEKDRKTMEKAFGCNVFDQYGSAESVVFASDCPFKNKHVSPEYGMVEVLDEKGDLVKQGEGELIVTGFLNDAMPLIRYRIGDYGKVTYKNCPCGRQTAIIEKLYGKVGSVVVSRGKKIPTAAIAIAFEYLQNVKKAQLVQNEPNKVIARIVTTPGFREKEEDFMKWELRKMLGEHMEIEVEKVEDIPPGKNGKYQMVLQNCYRVE